jgi:hypothetical protein
VIAIRRFKHGDSNAEEDFSRVDANYCLGRFRLGADKWNRAGGTAGTGNGTVGGSGGATVNGTGSGNTTMPTDPNSTNSTTTKPEGTTDRCKDAAGNDVDNNVASGATTSAIQNCNK